MSEGEATWPDAAKANAGAMIGIGHDGNAEIRRSLIRPEDKAAAKKAGGHPPNRDTLTVIAVPGCTVGESYQLRQKSAGIARQHRCRDAQYPWSNIPESARGSASRRETR